MKEKNYLDRLFIPIHLLIYTLLFISLYNQQYIIFSVGFIVFHTISIIWRLVLLKIRNDFTLNKVLGTILFYVVGFYLMYNTLSDGLSGLW